MELSNELKKQYIYCDIPLTSEMKLKVYKRCLTIIEEDIVKYSYCKTRLGLSSYYLCFLFKDVLCEIYDLDIQGAVYFNWLTDEISNRFEEFTHEYIKSIMKKYDTIDINKQRIRVLKKLIIEVKQKLKNNNTTTIEKID